MTTLEQLANSAVPTWAQMIDDRRQTSTADAAEADKANNATEWGRRGGTFHKGNEFFKK